MLASWKKSCDQLRQHIKKQKHYFANKGPSGQSYGFSSSHMHVRVGLYRELSTKELVLEKTLDSPWDCKEVQPVHPKGNQSWVFTGRTDAETKTPNTWATWCEELTHLKRPWCWGRLKVGGERDDGGWDGWMASLTWWTWVWAISGSWWWTGKPGVLQSMGLKEWENWTELLKQNAFSMQWVLQHISQTRMWQTRGS